MNYTSKKTCIKVNYTLTLPIFLFTLIIILLRTTPLDAMSDETIPLAVPFEYRGTTYTHQVASTGELIHIPGKQTELLKFTHDYLNKSAACPALDAFQEICKDQTSPVFIKHTQSTPLTGGLGEYGLDPHLTGRTIQTPMRPLWSTKNNISGQHITIASNIKQAEFVHAYAHERGHQFLDIFNKSKDPGFVPNNPHQSTINTNLLDDAIRFDSKKSGIKTFSSIPPDQLAPSLLYRYPQQQVDFILSTQLTKSGVKKELIPELLKEFEQAYIHNYYPTSAIEKIVRSNPTITPPEVERLYSLAQQVRRAEVAAHAWQLDIVCGPNVTKQWAPECSLFLNEKWKSMSMQNLAPANASTQSIKMPGSTLETLSHQPTPISKLTLKNQGGEWKTKNNVGRTATHYGLPLFDLGTHIAGNFAHQCYSDHTPDFNKAIETGTTEWIVGLPIHAGINSSLHLLGGSPLCWTFAGASLAAHITPPLLPLHEAACSTFDYNHLKSLKTLKEKREYLQDFYDTTPYADPSYHTSGTLQNLLKKPAELARKFITYHENIAALHDEAWKNFDDKLYQKLKTPQEKKEYIDTFFKENPYAHEIYGRSKGLLVALDAPGKALAFVNKKLHITEGVSKGWNALSDVCSQGYKTLSQDTPQGWRSPFDLSSGRSEHTCTSNSHATPSTVENSRNPTANNTHLPLHESDLATSTTSYFWQKFYNIPPQEPLSYASAAKQPLAEHDQSTSDMSLLSTASNNENQSLDQTSIGSKSNGVDTHTSTPANSAVSKEKTPMTLTPHFGALPGNPNLVGPNVDIGGVNGFGNTIINVGVGIDTESISKYIEKGLNNLAGQDVDSDYLLKYGCKYNWKIKTTGKGLVERWSGDHLKITIKTWKDGKEINRHRLWTTKDDLKKRSLSECLGHLISKEITRDLTARQKHFDEAYEKGNYAICDQIIDQVNACYPDLPEVKAITAQWAKLSNTGTAFNKLQVACNEHRWQEIPELHRVIASNSSTLNAETLLMRAAKNTVLNEYNAGNTQAAFKTCKEFDNQSSTLSRYRQGLSIIKYLEKTEELKKALAPETYNPLEAISIAIDLENAVRTDAFTKEEKSLIRTLAQDICTQGLEIARSKGKGEKLYESARFLKSRMLLQANPDPEQEKYFDAAEDEGYWLMNMDRYLEGDTLDANHIEAFINDLQELSSLKPDNESWQAELSDMKEKLKTNPAEVRLFLARAHTNFMKEQRPQDAAWQKRLTTVEQSLEQQQREACLRGKLSDSLKNEHDKQPDYAQARSIVAQLIDLKPNDEKWIKQWQSQDQELANRQFLPEYLNRAQIICDGLDIFSATIGRYLTNREEKDTPCTTIVKAGEKINKSFPMLIPLIAQYGIAQSKKQEGSWNLALEKWKAELLENVCLRPTKPDEFIATMHLATKIALALPVSEKLTITKNPFLKQLALKSLGGISSACTLYKLIQKSNYLNIAPMAIEGTIDVLDTVYFDLLSQKGELCENPCKYMYCDILKASLIAGVAKKYSDKAMRWVVALKALNLATDVVSNTNAHETNALKALVANSRHHFLQEDLEQAEKSAHRIKAHLNFRKQGMLNKIQKRLNGITFNSNYLELADPHDPIPPYTADDPEIIREAKLIVFEQEVWQKYAQQEWSKVLSLTMPALDESKNPTGTLGKDPIELWQIPNTVLRRCRALLNKATAQEAFDQDALNQLVKESKYYKETLLPLLSKHYKQETVDHFEKQLTQLNFQQELCQHYTDKNWTKVIELTNLAVDADKKFNGIFAQNYHLPLWKFPNALLQRCQALLNIAATKDAWWQGSLGSFINESTYYKKTLLPLLKEHFDTKIVNHFQEELAQLEKKVPVIFAARAFDDSKKIDGYKDALTDCYWTIYPKLSQSDDPATLLLLAATQLQFKTKRMQHSPPEKNDPKNESTIREHTQKAIELLKKFDSLPKDKDPQKQKHLNDLRAYLAHLI